MYSDVMINQPVSKINNITESIVKPFDDPEYEAVAKPVTEPDENVAMVPNPAYKTTS